MNHKEILEYICELLNINLKNKLVSDKILMTLKDMSVSYDLVKFGDFLESSFNYERFKFLSGYQKFLAMANEFKKENKPKLDELSSQRVYTYSQSLVKKLTDISFEIDYQAKIKGIDLKAINIAKTYENNLSDKDIEICKIIGYRLIYNLAISNIPKLEELIESNVNKKALEKQYPQLVVKKEKIEVLERLKNAK